MKIKIIYEDQDLLVVLKPAGLATQTARVGQADVVSELKNYLAGKQRKGKGVPYLGIVHRLDQPVEGLLVFAKTRQAAAALTEQLKQGSLHKKYYAVSCQAPPQERGRLEDWLYKDSTGTARIVNQEDAHFGEAKRAVLHYSVLQQAGALFLMEIEIETGRFHQIRAQMAHSGMPLLGDIKYGGSTGFLKKETGTASGGLALCACEIQFLQPVTGQQLQFRVSPQGEAFSCFHLKKSDEESS